MEKRKGKTQKCRCRQIGGRLYLMAAMILCVLSACGGKTEQEIAGADVQPGQESDVIEEPDDYSWIPEGREWVYLPESVLVDAPSVNYYSGEIIGDNYYFCYTEDNGTWDIRSIWCCRYDLSTKEWEKVQLKWDVEESARCIAAFPKRDSAGGMWVSMTYSMGVELTPRYYAAYFDKNGELMYAEERTEWRDETGNFKHIHWGVDSKGRYYEYNTDKIVLREKDGTSAGNIPHDDWSDCEAYPMSLETEDGKLIAFFHRGRRDASGNFSDGLLVAMDFDEKTLSTLAEGDILKGIAGIGKAPDTLAGKTGYYDLVLYDNRAVYGYSMANRTKEELFTWKECNITGKGIRGMGTMSDGRLYVMIDDWNSDDHRIVVFTEVSREEAPPMTILTLATVGEIGDDLNATAMRFNRYNFPYRVEAKSYETVNDLYNALLTGERIDILDLSRVKVSALTGQGLLEDLAPYLEKSDSGYHREDFVEGILEAYTVDGILTGIPDSFSIRTVVGDPARCGSGNGGLTLEAFLTAAEQNPDAKILEELDGLTREELMQYLMMFNMDEFVDWNTGECRFDSDEFKRVLACVKNFREPMKDEYADTLLQEKIESGGVLYFVADMDCTQALNLYQELFQKEEVCIGFPTPDGSGGHLLITQDAFGILVSSRHKDGAWKFVESVINHRIKYGGTDLTSLTISYNTSWNIYPTLQKTLDLFLDDIIERNQRSEEALEGEKNFTYIKFAAEGWDIPARHLSREEMLAGPDLAKDAKPYFDAEGDAIIRIVTEEAPAYYSGQKSLDAVAEIIQNRVKLYVMENR